MFYLNFMMPASGKANKEFEFDHINEKWIKVKDYKLGKKFDGFSIPVDSLRKAYDILKENQNHPVIYIQGGFVEGTNLKNMARRKSGDSPTIQNRYLQMICFDVDGYAGGIEDFISKELPKEFHNVDFIWQKSSSSGLTTTALKCHLYFWLKKPIHNIEIRKWIKDYNREKGWGTIIDPSVLNCNQPIYIQKRECNGAPDPIRNFIELVDKGEELDFDFTTISTPDIATKIVSKHADKLDISESIKEIINSENYHEAANRLAMSLLNDMSPRKVKKYIEGLFNSVENKDERWKIRYDDIDRSIETGLEKMTDLSYTIDEFIEWFHSVGAEERKENFAQKCALLNLAEREEAKTIVNNHIPLSKKVINSYVKDAVNELAEKKLELAKEKRKKERQKQGIYEIELTVANSGEVAEKICKILAESNKKPKVFSVGAGLASISLGKPRTIRQCHSLDVLGKDYPEMPLINVYRKPFSKLSDRIKSDVILQDSTGKDIEPSFRLLDVVGEGDNDHFLPLTGVIECPFIGADWKLVKNNGYNKKTGLYSVLHRKLKLTKLAPEKAYEYLTNVVFDEFPFKEDLDKAVAVAALMTAIQRPTISGNSGFPGFGIVSPTQSSGKTTLAQLISYSIFNRPVAATTLSQDDVELSKHLLGILQEGHSCVLFDNIKQGSQVTSDVLGKIMTSDIFSGRLLGENKTVSVPCSIVWLFTGNGVSFVGDFATRIYPININPKMEDPNIRKFKRCDIGQWAMDNRKHIISAVLSIVSAGEDSEEGMETGSRFKEWDRFVRHPLYKVTGVDINEAVKKNQKDDPLKLAKYNLLYQLHVVFGSRKFTTKEIISSAFGAFESGDTELGDSIIEVIGDKSKNTRSIGRYLASIVEVVMGGLVLVKHNSNVVKWVINKLEDNE